MPSKSTDKIKILFIGDIVGRPGREAIGSLLSGLKKEKKIDFVVANSENAAGGSGLTVKVVNELFDLGCNVLTSGDHIWRRRDVFNIIDHPYFLRPINLSKLAPGKGYCIYRLKIVRKTIEIAVLNLQGRVFMDPTANCPFTAVKEVLPEIQKQTKIIFVDFHAEATSEKIAMSHFLDGQVTGLFGTHTHVQTADDKILPTGTAYITDAGMTGPQDSVIGRRKEAIIERFLTGIHTRFEVATNGVQLQGVVVEVDVNTAHALSIKRVQCKAKED